MRHTEEDVVDVRLHTQATASPGNAIVSRMSGMRIGIVKRDRLAAECILHAAQRALPEPECVYFNSATLALDALRERPAHIGIFGLTLPEMDGVDLITTAMRERLVFRILVVSSRGDELVRSRLRPGRINGFFDPASDDPGRLATAIRRVAEGGTYFSPSFALGRAGLTVDQMFTPHQMRIFAALCTSGDEREAASMLGLSQHTVHGHSQRIKRKLGLKKSSTLVLEGLRRGIIRVTSGEVLRPGYDSPVS